VARAMAMAAVEVVGGGGGSPWYCQMADPATHTKLDHLLGGAFEHLDPSMERRSATSSHS
jgi:hypothetical protein